MKTTMMTLLKWAAVFAFLVVFGKPIMNAMIALLTAVQGKLP